ncbi:hypothetical protein H1R20_g4015, partial [Candolleomyces eurysporus]
MIGDVLRASEQCPSPSLIHPDVTEPLSVQLDDWTPMKAYNWCAPHFSLVSTDRLLIPCTLTLLITYHYHPRTQLLFVFRAVPQMGDRSVHSEAAFSSAGTTEARTDSTHREVQFVQHYHGIVNIVHAENAIFGNNYGILYQGSDQSHPVTGNQHLSIDSEADLIRLLRPIPDASHTRDRKLSPPNSACFPGTRTDVIRRIVAWADSTLLWNTHVLWLYGYVGCGKSAIALAIALKFEERNRLVGSFFFFRNSGDRSRMIRFATTLACQLAAAIPEAAPFIEKAVKAEPGLLKSSLVSQLRRLVYEPLKAATKRGRLLRMTLLKGPFLIVIDGLDECDDRQDVQAFIGDMLEFFKKNPLVPLRFFITSRVEQHIQGHLKSNQVRLENLVNHCSRNDIDTFMTTCFEIEKSRNSVINTYVQKHGEWPTKQDKNQLVDHIGGSFIFASALFGYIADPTNKQSTPMERLPHTLNMNPGLDSLYLQTLSRSQDLPYFSNIISTLALLFEPLPIAGIAELLGIESFEVVRVLIDLQAIIHIPGTDDLPVTMCHTSLRDFLTTESRSKRFFVPPSFHIYLTNRCYDLKKEGRSGTAVASYITGHYEEHLQALVPLYPQILANSQDLPHFSDIISTITLLSEPLPIVGIANLLGIEALEVYQVLANLQAIVDSPEIGKDTPVAMRHPSLRDFLTTKTRSGTLFVPPCCTTLHHHQLHNIVNKGVSTTGTSF